MSPSECGYCVSVMAMGLVFCPYKPETYIPLPPVPMGLIYEGCLPFTFWAPRTVSQTFGSETSLAM